MYRSPVDRIGVTGCLHLGWADPLPQVWRDKHEWKHYVLAGGNNDEDRRFNEEQNLKPKNIFFSVKYDEQVSCYKGELTTVIEIFSVLWLNGLVKSQPSEYKFLGSRRCNTPVQISSPRTILALCSSTVNCVCYIDGVDLGRVACQLEPATVIC